MKTACVAAIGLSLPLHVFAGFPADIKFEDFGDHPEELQAYGTEVGVATAGLGIGLAVILGFLMFVGCLCCCCRCKRNKRMDLALSDPDYDVDDKFVGVEPAKVEKNVVRGKKILWIGSVMIFLAYLLCAGLAYQAALDLETTFDNAHGGIDTFLSDTQNSLCGVAGTEECTEGSVGDFLYDMNGIIGGVLDGFVDYLESLGDLLDPLDAMIVSLDDMEVDRAAGEALYADVVTETNAVQATLTANSGGIYDMTLTLPVIDNADTVAWTVIDGQVAGTRAATVTTRDEMHDLLVADDSAIVQTSNQIDDTPGNEGGGTDLRGELTTALDEMVDQLRGLTDDIYDFQTHEVADLEVDAEKYLQMAALAVGVLVFFPAIILAFCMVFAKLCNRPSPFYFSMFFVFWVQGLYCLLAGVFLLIAKINGDICAAHKDIIETNLDVGLVVNGFEIDLPEEGCRGQPPGSCTMLGTALVQVLECEGRVGDSPTRDNNFVDIFGLTSLFDVEDQVNETADVVRDQKTTVEAAKDPVYDAQAALQLIDPYLCDVVGRSSWDLAAATAVVDAKVATFPVTDFDRTDAAQVALFEAEYMTGGLAPLGFTWSTGVLNYDAEIAALNTFLTSMRTASLNSWSASSDATLQLLLDVDYDAETIRTFAGAIPALSGGEYAADKVCPDGATVIDPFDAGGGVISLATGETIYAANTDEDELCTLLQTLKTSTMAIDGEVLSNNDFISEAATIRTQLQTIDSKLLGMVAEQDDIAAGQAAVDASLDDMITDNDEAQDGLDTLADSFGSITDQVENANEYAMCGFVGDFHRTVYEGAICGDFQGLAKGVSGPLLAVIVFMVVSFTLHGCYAQNLRRRPDYVRPLAGVVADGMDAQKHEKKMVMPVTPKTTGGHDYDDEEYAYEAQPVATTEEDMS